jgi:calcineurin-like phosphoesterase family protein
MQITLDTWLVSDTHFRHKNIIKYCNRPMNHDKIMVTNWFLKIKLDDPVLHLGDVQVWYNELEMFTAETIVRSLSGKISLIKGNHDKFKDKVWKDMGLTVVPEFIQEFDGQRVLFSHYPDVNRLGQWDINIHGHIHNSGYGTEINTNRDYRNISMEVMNYEPVRLRDVLYGGRHESSRKVGHRTAEQYAQGRPN